MFSEFVYVNENSLSPELCNRIIQLFDNDNNKYEGLTLSGLKKNIKNTMDLSMDVTDTKWKKIVKLLEIELIKNVKTYIDNLNQKIIVCDTENVSGRTFNIFHYKNLTTFGSFMAQRYTKCEGKYVYHNDFRIDYENKRHRVLTYLWYLNDVTEGGETDFWGNKITPTTGKLLLFPASWCFPHRGIMPISNDKYIITGWLYVAE